MIAGHLTVTGTSLVTNTSQKEKLTIFEYLARQHLDDILQFKLKCSNTSEFVHSINIKGTTYKNNMKI